VKNVYGINLGTFVYESPADAFEKFKLEGMSMDGQKDIVGELQSFAVHTRDPVSGMHIPPLSAVTIAIQSNYGDPLKTCVYRIKVLGTLAVPSTSQGK
jgi:hypothetical protein